MTWSGASVGRPPALLPTWGVTSYCMDNSAHAAELESLLVIAEDIRDGRRSEPFTREELVGLCQGIQRAIALVSEEHEE